MSLKHISISAFGAYPEDAQDKAIVKAESTPGFNKIISGSIIPANTAFLAVLLVQVQADGATIRKEGIT